MLNNHGLHSFYFYGYLTKLKVMCSISFHLGLQTHLSPLMHIWQNCQNNILRKINKIRHFFLLKLLKLFKSHPFTYRMHPMLPSMATKDLYDSNTFFFGLINAMDPISHPTNIHWVFILHPFFASHWARHRDIYIYNSLYIGHIKMQRTWWRLWEANSSREYPYVNSQLWLGVIWLIIH